MRIYELFRFKSPEQRAEDSRRYDHWAFPYGEVQKQIVEQKLSQLLPEEKPQTAMAIYLIGREGYLGSCLDNRDDVRTEQQRLMDAQKALKKQLPGGLRKLLPRYLAIILADAQVGETLVYPEVEELRSRALELEAALPKRK